MTRDRGEAGERIVAFEVPYRIESLQAISAAIRTNFLGIGSLYLSMYELAKRVGDLDIPPAMSNAREFVEKSFLQVDEEKIRECGLEYREVADLPLVSHSSLIEAAVPWAVEFAGHDTLFDALRSFPEEVRRLCRLGGAENLLGAYESVQAIRCLLQSEILAYVRTRRTRRVGLEDLKRLMVAYTLHQPGNEDVLQALRKSMRREPNGSLRQNAVAELLFCRLPRLVEGLTRVDPRLIRAKLLRKLGRIDLTAAQRTNLIGLFEPSTGEWDLLPTLERIRSVAGRIVLADEARRRLCDFIVSLRDEVLRIRRLYDLWFLTSELRRMRKIYTPRNVMECRIAVEESLVRRVVDEITLSFYPTKDWLDLCKGKTSSDCTNWHLGREHLLAPPFFNVRIFRGSDWIGNIYMLDFTRQNGWLLVDRIQIPRGIEAGYVRFFDYLREVFEELFEGVEYEGILMPLRISNHASIQKAFNDYKEKLERRSVRFPSRYRRSFESLSGGGGYYLLASRPKRRTPSGEVAACSERPL